MKRGDLVLAAITGDYGKPRPWVIVQSDLVPHGYPGLTLCPLSTTDHGDRNFRIPVEPSSDNGLRVPSRVMVDKIQSINRGRARVRIGSLDADVMRRVDSALRVWLGLA